jgi:DNA-binding CsgD family transcriptional regulator
VFLLALLLFLLYKLQKGVSKRKKTENEWLEKQLSIKNKEMTSNVMHLLQVTETSNNLLQKLVRLRAKANKDLYQDLTSIINEVQHGNQGMNWQEFERLFIETNAGFYKKLLEDFPSLSQNEVRLCAFLKLNLSTKEISAITKQSVNSITVARSRLRKKLDIDNDESSLISFLSSY